MKKFFKGMDISSLPAYFDAGEHFYDEMGKECDPFDLLAANHVNSVRLRIWNQPELVPESKGYCDLAHTIEMAKKIKEHNMHFVLDFHYSDYWADPGQQRKPKAWEDLSFSELVDAVYTFTFQTLSVLREEGCLPDMVQVGNEIRSGLLFPDGAVPHYENIATLLNAGIEACRDISKDITVMIHLDQGGRFYYLKEWFDAVFAAGLHTIDAIGISFYSFWHGTFMDLRDSMQQLIDTYHLPVYVVETAHPWRICSTGHVFEDIMKTAGLPAGIKEQRRSLELVMQIAASVSGELDSGVYYWEPLCIPGHGHGSWDENMGMLDLDGQILPSFHVYRDFDPEHPCEDIDDLNAFMESLYEVDESDLPPMGTNLVSNGDFSDGTTGFWVTHTPEDVTVKAEDNEVYVSSNQNFVFKLAQDIHINKAGKYVLSTRYRGTNTTGVRIHLFLKVITCNGETSYTKEIFPSDVAFVTHKLEPVELPVGQVQIGIEMDTPPVFGRITDIRLIEVTDNTNSEN